MLTDEGPIEGALAPLNSGSKPSIFVSPMRVAGGVKFRPLIVSWSLPLLQKVGGPIGQPSSRSKPLSRISRRQVIELNVPENSGPELVTTAEVSKIVWGASRSLRLADTVVPIRPARAAVGTTTEVMAISNALTSRTNLFMISSGPVSQNCGE